MNIRRDIRRPGPNRVIFYVVVGLAVVTILCTLVIRAAGLPRVCGGVLVVVGGLLTLLAEDKRWPALIVLIGLALFFSEALLGLFIPGNG